MRAKRRVSNRARARRRLAARACLLLAATVAWSGAAAKSLDVVVHDGLVSVDARDVPLGQIMQTIADQAGFRLVLKEDLRTPVTWSFQDVPVDRAVARLLVQASSVSLYAPSNGAAGPVLSEVRVLRGGRAVVAAVEHGAATPPDYNAEVAALAPAASPMISPADGTAPSGAMDNGPALGQERIREIIALQPASARRDLPEALSNDQDPAVRRMAAVGVGKLRPETAGGALSQALSDPDTVVRQRAVQGLTRVGGEEAITALSRVLLEDSEPRIRRMAAAGLGRMNTESAFWALMEANSDEDQSVREAVSAALASLERRGVNARNR